VADHGRLAVARADDRLEVVGDLADALAREDVGVGVGLLDGLGIAQSPWMKTTGCRPDSLARVTSAASCSVMPDMLGA
jgi:hypothetical protein